MDTDTSGQDEETRSGEEQGKIVLIISPRLLYQTRQAVEIQEQEAKHLKMEYSTEAENQ